MILQNTDAGNGNVSKVQLLTKKEDQGYITYVFLNLDSTCIYDKYIMCVRFPNWDCCTIDIGDKGFLNYRFVTAGKDVWYNKTTDSFEHYKQTDCHFIDFVREETGESTNIIL